MSDLDMSAVARRQVRITIRSRTYRYRADRMRMCVLHPDLWCASPTRMIAIAEVLIEQERSTPRRYFGMGGEVPLLNAMAVRLLARWERRYSAPEHVSLRRSASPLIAAE